MQGLHRRPVVGEGASGATASSSPKGYHPVSAPPLDLIPERHGGRSRVEFKNDPTRGSSRTTEREGATLRRRAEKANFIGGEGWSRHETEPIRPATEKSSETLSPRRGRGPLAVKGREGRRGCRRPRGPASRCFSLQDVAEEHFDEMRTGNPGERQARTPAARSAGA